MGRRIYSDICKNVIEAGPVDLYELFTSKEKDDNGETYEECFEPINDWQLIADADCGEKGNLSGYEIVKMFGEQKLTVNIIETSPTAASGGDRWYVVESNEIQSIQQFIKDFGDLFEDKNILREKAISQVI